MSSKVKVIKTINGWSVFEITSDKLTNVVEGVLRRSVTRKDVAKFFENPKTGAYGVGRNRAIKTSYDDVYAEYLQHEPGYYLKFDIFIDENKHFNIGCMEFGFAETRIIRRWALSYAKTLAAKSSTKVKGKKSSNKAA